MKPISAPAIFFPWQTAFIVAATLGIAASPGLTSEFTATGENWIQVWPIFTGHLCHWTGSHLFWDLLVFMIAGPLVERRLGRAFLPCLGLVSMTIIAAVFVLMPEIESYRGLSGIDSFLYTFAVLDLIRRAYPRIPDKLRPLTVLPLFLLIAKIIFEIMTGVTLFSGSLGDGVIPLPIAHAAGALTGLLIWQSCHGRRCVLSTLTDRI